MIEIELPDPTMTVPEGLKFAVAHFLTVPEEGFRNIIEGDNHQHHIVKISPRDGGFDVAKFGAFTRVDDKFSFETEDLKNERLCHLTTGWFGRKYPYCNHGSKQTFLVGWKEHICPHSTNAMDLYLVCGGSRSTLSDSVHGRKILKHLTFDHDITPGQKFQIVTDLGGESKPVTFSFLDLCKENGLMRLRTIPSYLNVDCKQNDQPINFLIFRREGEKEELLNDSGDYIPRCEHEGECQVKKMKQNQLNLSSPSQSRLVTSNTTYNIHGSTVANVGSDGKATVTNQRTN